MTTAMTPSTPHAVVFDACLFYRYYFSINFVATATMRNDPEDTSIIVTEIENLSVSVKILSTNDA